MSSKRIGTVIYLGSVNIRVQRARLWVIPGRGFLVKAVQVKSV